MPNQDTSHGSGRPALPALFQGSPDKPMLQYQGAEALVYKTWYPVTPNDESYDSNTEIEHIPALPAFLKHRPAKPYRHPILDAKLTRHRILAEARVLLKLLREGVAVPAVFALDWEEGWMLGEWVEGGTVRALMDAEVPGWLDETRTDSEKEQSYDLPRLMTKIGKLAGRMHEVGVVHGDLTTSNLMLRGIEATTSIDDAGLQQSHGDSDSTDSEVVLIDFGLASQTVHEEERAVDLYVLERAFGSTHPKTEALFGEVLKSYSASYKGAKAVLKRLDEVRMRGRKKIAIG
ncbi:MAG: serine/threonine-protein kinase bud32 [Alyxoria varia]|nr:MAG: serine/threonine-protein kinase bud32 [Alyxoria varia]